MRIAISCGPALHLQGLVKRFGAHTVLKGVDLTLQAGSIHALLGENGAGKSTLIKILAGLVPADEGHISVAGTPLAPTLHPRERAALGLRFVHQDLSLIDTLSIDDNLALETGYPTTRYGLIAREASRRQCRDRLAALGSELDPDGLVGELSQAEKVIVALARAMDEQATVLVLDEVTASLPAPEAQRLHTVIERARLAGVAILFVSHRLDEVQTLCDQVTVLRDGQEIATAAMAEVDKRQLLHWIAGSDMPAPSPAAQAGPHTRDRFTVDGLQPLGLTQQIDLCIRAGEIVGLTGLMGSGYEAVAECLAGLRPALAGSVSLDGQSMPTGSAHLLRRAGVQAISGHRHHSAFATLSTRENIFPTHVAAPAGYLPTERRRAAEILARYSVHPAGASERTLASLSGGNQQKVLFARALETSPRVLVMIDPTAGVDVGSRAYLYALLRAATEDGLAVLLASSDFEEIEQLADRALVMADGSLTGNLSRTELRQARLVHAALSGPAALPSTVDPIT